MCAPAWELLAKTATMGLVCALCALMLSIHAQNAGPTPALVHTAAALAETPAGLFCLAAVGVPLLQSQYRGL
jgi:hypothetical protein